MPDIVILGSGMGGLGAAYRLHAVEVLSRRALAWALEDRRAAAC